MKRMFLAVLLLMLVSFAVACDSSTDGDSNKSDENEATIEVEHELGTTTVPVNPEKVVVFDFGSLDTLDYLGVEVVAVPQASVPDYLSKFESNDYQNAGTLFEPDFELLANLNPDLIIISGRTQESYSDLSELAPTIYLSIEDENYMESFEANALLLGEIFEQEEKAKEAVEKIKTEVSELANIMPDDKTGLIILTNDGSLSAYGPGSRFGIIHDVFGVTPAETDIESTTHGQNISFEYVANVNPDYLFVMDRNAVIGGEHNAASTLNNDLIDQTTAAKENQIIYLTPDYWYLSSGGVESVTQMVSEIRAAIE